MKISLTWLNTIIDIKHISVQDLSEKLTLAGFEVDEIKEIKDSNKNTIDIVLDIATTANRGDCLSLMGLAREIAALYDLNYIVKKTDQSLNCFNADKILFKNVTNTSFYSLTLINNIKIKSSPLWLQNFLNNIGILPENNIKDILNYILIKYGQPMHSFDVSNIIENDNPIICEVILASQKDEITLDSLNKYPLNNSNLVTKLNQHIMSLSGICENYSNKTKAETSTILLEMGIFKPTIIRQSSTTLNLRTESSIRFERGVDKNLLFEAYSEAINLINQLTDCKILACNYQENNLKKILPKIQINLHNIQTTLGQLDNISLTSSQVENVLKRLGFTYENNLSGWLVKIPNHRVNDIEREIDLIEEIGRIIGYNQFRNISPSINKNYLISPKQKITRYIQNFFLSNGFVELINYSFQPYLAIKKEKSLKLTNPLNLEQQYLRNSLLPELIKTYEYNFAQDNQSLNGFEIGRVFNKYNKIIQEETFLASIWGGNKIKSHWSGLNRTPNWFEAKGFVENLFKFININIHWQQDFSSGYFNKFTFHLFRWGIIYYKNSEIGIFGQMHPKINKELNSNYNLYLLEVNLEKIYNICLNFQYNLHTFTNYSIYPSISRDINVIAPIEIPITNFKDKIYNLKNPFLISMELFDDYRDTSLINQRRLSFRLFFRSNSGTLKIEQVDNYTKEIQNALNQ